MDRLRAGQALEASGHLPAAVAAYDEAIALLANRCAPGDPGSRRLLGLTWMNRGNALQKIATPAASKTAVAAYDEAIRNFETFAPDAEPALRNHLGAAWLNRGHALMTAGEPSAEISFQRAIHELGQLPLDANPHYRLNLAGAWTNLAHVHLASHSCASSQASRAAAQRALEVLAPVERTHVAFAAMGLRARRAWVMALGELLAAAEQRHEPIVALASEATDAIEDGLAIARDFEARGVPQLRPLALRLFRLGAQLYGTHQPHFLEEFIRDNCVGSLGAEAEFHAAAHEALTRALGAVQQPQLLLPGTGAAEKLLATARSLRAALQLLSIKQPQSSLQTS